MENAENSEIIVEDENSEVSQPPFFSPALHSLDPRPLGAWVPPSRVRGDVCDGRPRRSAVRPHAAHIPTGDRGRRIGPAGQATEPGDAWIQRGAAPWITDARPTPRKAGRVAVAESPSNPTQSESHAPARVWKANCEI